MKVTLTADQLPTKLVQPDLIVEQPDGAQLLISLDGAFFHIAIGGGVGTQVVPVGTIPLPALIALLQSRSPISHD